MLLARLSLYRQLLRLSVLLPAPPTADGPQLQSVSDGETSMSGWQDIKQREDSN